MRARDTSKVQDPGNIEHGDFTESRGERCARQQSSDTLPPLRTQLSTCEDKATLPITSVQRNGQGVMTVSRAKYLDHQTFTDAQCFPAKVVNATAFPSDRQRAVDMAKF
jgi:hypothetical protein